MSDIFEEADEIEFEVVTMTDNDGAEVEFSIIDNVACGGERYLLVVEISINMDDVTYELVEDDAEFHRVADLFAQKGEDYEVELH